MSSGWTLCHLQKVWTFSQALVSLVLPDLVSLLGLCEDVVLVLVSLLDLGEVEKDLVGLASTYYHLAVREA
jgi:hypothetical protein